MHSHACFKNDIQLMVLKFHVAINIQGNGPIDQMESSSSYIKYFNTSPCLSFVLNVDIEIDIQRTAYCLQNFCSNWNNTEKLLSYEDHKRLKLISVLKTSEQLVCTHAARFWNNYLSMLFRRFPTVQKEFGVFTVSYRVFLPLQIPTNVPITPTIVTKMLHV